ncbi:hypothetical protein AKO1_001425, partial [Acrasis kona]
MLLKRLNNLHLINVEKAEGDQIVSFQLKVNVVFRNKTFTLKNLQNVATFWREMENAKTSKATDDESVAIKKAEWSEIRYYTLPQIRILEEFYQKNPNPSALECQAIRFDTKVAYENIVLYYFRHRDKILRQKITGDILQNKLVTAGRGRKKKKKTNNNNDNFIEYQSDDNIDDDLDDHDGNNDDHRQEQRRASKKKNARPGTIKRKSNRSRAVTKKKKAAAPKKKKKQQEQRD